jgi:hypothetical protein
MQNRQSVIPNLDNGFNPDHGNAVGFLFKRVPEDALLKGIFGNPAICTPKESPATGTTPTRCSTHQKTSSKLGEDPTSVDGYVKKHSLSFGEFEGETHNPPYGSAVAAVAYRHLVTQIGK